MSGGSYDYLYVNIIEYYAGKTFDEELDRMIVELAYVLQKLEWWQSGDTDEEAYRTKLKKFKNKWFKKNSQG